MNKKCVRNLVAMSLVIGLSTWTKGYGEKSQISSTPAATAHKETKKFIEVMGIGVADPTLVNVAQRRALSREAAIVNAQYKLREILTQRIRQTQNTHEISLQGARVIKSVWTTNDDCHVTVRLDKKEYQQLTGVKLR